MDGLMPHPSLGQGHAYPPAPFQPENPTIHLTRPVATSHQGKTAGDYVRALWRRGWLALAVALPVGVAGCLAVLGMKDVYRAQAQVLIESPHFDDILAGLLTHQGVGGGRAHEPEVKYVANRLMKLRGLELAGRVVRDPSVDPPPPGSVDPAMELWKGLSTKMLPQTSRCEVALEGTDPRRAAQWLNRLIEIFCEDLQKEHENQIQQVKRQSNVRLQALRTEQNEIEKKVHELAERNKAFTAGGGNVFEKRYGDLTLMLAQKRGQIESLEHDAMMSRLYPRNGPGAAFTSEDHHLETLIERKRRMTLEAKRIQGVTKKNFDPARTHLANQLSDVIAQIEEIQAHKRPAEPLPDFHEMLIDRASRQFEEIKAEADQTFNEWQDSTPDHQKYLRLLADRDEKIKAIAQMEARIADFGMLADTKSKPAEVLQAAAVPVTPVKPNRPMMIGGMIVLALGLGCGLVCLLETLDRKVRVPERVSLDLGLPLCGVVPRIRRSAKLHRGGHLWTPAMPASVEADAYRNLRASLLGMRSVSGGSVVTLLVTSAKAGEGKSTTALNLAATCARAGERTLLIDVDLRRPSLTEVFEGARDQAGLVGFLRGEVPWQRTVVRTDLPHLDFLPTGDPRDVPIEVLGTLELRQLILAVSGQYDRVILDGPAVLGMADCRMLGRLVDAALLVVRSGAHEVRPLMRAKAMLEQSRVPLAGVVFNGLIEDFKDWSSYGSAYDAGYGALPGPSARLEAATPALVGAGRA